jgi:hypothetical protein
MPASLFRRVDLTPSFRGRLYLTNMPGYWRPAEFHAGFWQQITEGSADAWVVCLAGKAERKRKSPDYPQFLEAAKLGERWIEFPIRGRSVPADTRRFWLC